MYQELFNEYLKKIRWLCNATNNGALGNEIVKISFDFSDELKNNNLINEELKNSGN